MSEINSSQSQRREKTKEQYSRNVKKLKVRLSAVQKQALVLDQKLRTLKNTSNDKLIALKICRFCKQRRMTPEMLFRFADRKRIGSVTKIAFRQLLAQLGLQLTKQQELRLEYLIDEDLSGQISQQEYYRYLQAFGIKKQFTPGDQLAREVLQKIDLSKILQPKQDQNSVNQPGKPKNSNLLNYEEFLKYCHRHFPALKNKQLAAIFTRLEKNQLINLRDLIDYLEGQQAEKKRLQQKNKKKSLPKRSNSVVIGTQSLKRLLQELIKSRGKNGGPLFHSNQFRRLEKLLNSKRGQLMQLFQEIDQKRKISSRGSFTYNDLINYFIQKTQKAGIKQDLPFAFELMADSLRVSKQSPQAIVAQYTSNSQYLTQSQLQKLFQSQFEILGSQNATICKLVPRQTDGKYDIQKVVALLSQKSGNNNIFIKPSMMVSRLIFGNARQALKCCLQLEEKLVKMKQQLWSDYEFGPTEADEFGIQSISLPLPSEQVSWIRTEQLGMNQFYQKDLNTTFKCSNICPNQIFAKTAFSLFSIHPSIVWSTQKLNELARDVRQEQLVPIFFGVYPLAFHNFSKYGIYVIKLFLKQKWKYVIIDNKVPCNDKIPLFSYTSNLRYSFLSLIEKAYAKGLGSYERIYQSSHPARYCHQLTNILSLEYALQPTMPELLKNQIWESMVRFQREQLKATREGKGKYKQLFLYGILRSRLSGEEKNLATNIPFQIQEIVEIADGKCKNTHKSHRILLMKSDQSWKEESSWNPSWNRNEGNKYSQLSIQLADRLAEPAILKNKNVSIINFKLFRKFFSLLRYQKIQFTNMIILRKQIQFQEKIKCRYEFTAKSDLEVTVLLAKRSAMQGIQIAINVKNAKSEIMWQQVRKQELIVFPFRVEKGQSLALQLGVQNWRADVEHNFNLTLYLSHPRYELRQRDRHLLFRYVSPYEEEPKLDLSEFESEAQKFIYRQFYRAAERRGCCG